ncbi:MAG: hypothetical protein LBK96_03595 [Prevotellaceae bacterium]|nr:hypothetical protein [Prevotellaceae bacterium]
MTVFANSGKQSASKYSCSEPVLEDRFPSVKNSLNENENNSRENIPAC